MYAQREGKGEKMKRLLRGLTRVSTLFPLVLMAAMAMLVPSQVLSSTVLAVLTSALGLAMWSLIIIGYTPPLIRILRRENKEPYEQNLVLGQVILWTMIAGWSVWRIAFIVMGQPKWMVGHWLVSLLSACAALSGFYFLSVPGISRLGLSYMTIGVFLSVFLFVVGLFFVEGALL